MAQAAVNAVTLDCLRETVLPEGCPLLAQFSPLFVLSKQMGFTDLPKLPVILRELSLARFLRCS